MYQLYLSKVGGKIKIKIITVKTMQSKTIRKKVSQSCVGQLINKNDILFSWIM